MTRLRTVLAMTLFAAVTAGAQPADGGDPIQAGTSTDDNGASSVAGSMEVAAHLWGVIGRYRFAATADLVRVTLVRPGGRSDMHSMEVRCVPGATGLARLDLGDLTLEARQGRLRAVHRRDPTTYVSESVMPSGTDASLPGDPASVLRDALPQLPIPHLSLAFDTAEVDWCPLVTGLVWERAERLSDGTRDGVRLLGTTDMGRASLEIAGARVRRFEADLEPTGQTRVIVDCEPLEPSDPDGWVLGVQERRRVTGLSRLESLGPRLVPGQLLPQVDIRGIGSEDGPVLPEPDEPTIAGGLGFRVVLLLRDSSTPSFIGETVRKVVDAYQSTSRDLLRGRIDGLYDKRVRLNGLSGLVEVTTDATVFDRLNAKAEAWANSVGTSEPNRSAQPKLGWFVTDTRLVDRLALSSEAVVVVLDENRQIRAVLPLGDGVAEVGIRHTLLGVVVPVR